MTEELLTLTSLPLFPLGTVLFPGGVLPLRVFEVRYLDMIGKCHRAGAPFGVVALTQGHEVRAAGAPPEQLATIGTLAHITTLEQPQAGLPLVQCRGEQRFRIDRPVREEEIAPRLAPAPGSLRDGPGAVIEAGERGMHQGRTEVTPRPKHG